MAHPESGAAGTARQQTTSTTQRQPEIGDPVFYVDASGVQCIAFVTGLIQGPHMPCDLYVMPPGQPGRPERAVMFSPALMRGCWTWRNS